MTLIRTLNFILMFAFATGAAERDAFDLKVERVRMLRNEPGDLHIDAQEVRFRSSDGRTSIAVPMQDLRDADVADPHALRFETYDVQKWKPTDRREYTFRAASDAPVEELAQFLAARVHRPVVGHYTADFRYRIPAYHRRIRGGTHGTLEIGEDAIRFVSDKPPDSRTWLYRDIETIGRPDSFRFRITTNRETYVVELKSDLPQSAYELAWGKIYKREGTAK